MGIASVPHTSDVPDRASRQLGPFGLAGLTTQNETLNVRSLVLPARLARLVESFGPRPSGFQTSRSAMLPPRAAFPGKTSDQALSRNGDEATPTSTRIPTDGS